MKAPKKIKAPAPGIYFAVPDADYRAWDAVSKSDLDSFVNPRGLIGRNLLIGSVLHAMLLEGKIATSERYFTCDDYDLRTNIGKQGIADDEAREGKIAVRQKEKTTIVDMYRAVMANEDAMKIIDAEGENEVSIIGKHEDFDTLCRSRLDMVRRGCIADLKTTGCVDRGDFKNSSAKFKYNVQGAYYTDLYAQVSDVGYLPFVHVCVSTRRHPETDEHEVWVEPMAWDAMAYGRQHYKDILTLYERAQDANE